MDHIYDVHFHKQPFFKLDIVISFESNKKKK